MSSYLSWLPGVQIPGLVRQAWDATKLGAAIREHRRQQKAVVLREAKANDVDKYHGAGANRRQKEIIESGDVQEIAKLFLPSTVVQKGSDLNQVFWKVWDIYWLFLFARFLLVFVPLSPGGNGSVEVDAVVGSVFRGDGNVGNFTSNPTSLTTVSVIYGTPLYGLKLMSLLTQKLLGISLIGVYSISFLIKMTSFLLTLILDYCVYQFCCLFEHTFNQCLTTLASSYIILTSLTSVSSVNSLIETTLIAYLIHVVAVSMKRTSESVYLQSMVQQSYDKADSAREKVKVLKQKKNIPGYDYVHFIPISVICALGLFNSPFTFPILALAPLFFWFQRGITNQSYFTPFVTLHFRMVSLIPGFFITGFILTLADSIIFGDDFLDKVWELEDLKWDDWKCVPIQSLLNAVEQFRLAFNQGEGEKQSEEPQTQTVPIYHNSLINIPASFGPLGLAALVSVANFFAELIQNERIHLKPKVRNPFALILYSFFTPVFIFSILGYEHDFKTLVLPAVLFASHHLRLKSFGWKPLLWIWYLFNVVGILLNGFLLNNGFNLIGNLPLNEWNGHTHHLAFVSSKMPPKWPLDLLHGQHNLHFHHINDLDPSKLQHSLEKLISKNKWSNELYAAIPGSYSNDIVHTLKMNPINDLTRIHLDFESNHQLTSLSLHIRDSVKSLIFMDFDKICENFNAVYEDLTLKVYKVNHLSQ